MSHPHTPILTARAHGGGRYELRALTGKAEAELLIYGEIGADPFADESVGAGAIVTALAELPVDYLTVRINSYGGVVSDGLAIHNALRRHQAAVTVAVDGVAFSIASLIAMAGDTVQMAENALMMLHAPWGLAMGNARDLRDLADTMDKYAEAMATAYANKTGRDKAEFVALLTDGADHYYTAAEAVEAGLADQVTAEAMRLAAADRSRLRDLYRRSLPAAAFAALGHPTDPPVTAAPRSPAPAGTPAPATSTEGNTMPNDATRASGSGGDAPTDNVITINAAREDAVKAERERIAEIQAIARAYPQLAEDAAAAIQAGSTLDAFRAVIIPKLGTPRPLGMEPGQLDMERADRNSYSLMKAMRAHVSGDWKQAGLERECSIAIAARAKRDPRGFFVPTDLHWGSPVRAVQTKETDTAGGYLVRTDTGDFIDNLRALSVLFGLGARRLGDLQGDMSFPKKTGSASFTWISEDTDSADTALTFGALSMSPKTASGSVPISRKLLLQSSPDIEMLVRDDLLTGAALAVDLAGINGSGVGAEPQGVINTTGVNTTAISTDTAPTFVEMVSFESEVATDNALLGTLAYLTTPTIRGVLKTTKKDAGSGEFVWTGNDVNGYAAAVSSQVPTSKIIFGNWSDLLIGFWGTIDVKVDEATKAASGGLVLRAFVDADTGVRRPTSFCVGT